MTLIWIGTAAVQVTAIAPSYPILHLYRPFKIGCTSVHQLYRKRITTKWIKMVHGTFVTSIQIRKAAVQAYSNSSQLSHSTSVQTINIGCTSVHQPYKMQITTKWIESEGGTLVTSIQIRTVDVRVYSHSSQLSHT